MLGRYAFTKYEQHTMTIRASPLPRGRRLRCALVIAVVAVLFLVVPLRHSLTLARSHPYLTGACDVYAIGVCVRLSLSRRSISARSHNEVDVVERHGSHGIR